MRGTCAQDCPHKNSTYSWVEGEAKENKTCTDCTFNEVVDARRVVIFTTCYNNGAIQSPIVEGTSTLTVDFGNMPTHIAQHGLVAGQWSYVSGGVKNYVFSVDGGNTWYMVHNVSSGAVATENHYSAIVGKINDIVAKANCTHENTGITTNDNCEQFCAFCGDKVSDELLHGETTINANCEQVCSVCGIKVSAELVHTPAENYVPSETEEGVLVKKCTKCGEVLETSTCAHENTEVTYNTETYKKVTTCTDCGNVTEADCSHSNTEITYNTSTYKKITTCTDCTKVTEEDCVHASYTYSWVEGEAKENKTCSDCTYNEVIDARFVVIFQSTYKVGTDAQCDAIMKYFPSFATEHDKNVITTVAGAVQFSTRTGSGYGLEVDQVKAVAKAVEDGYLESTTSTFTIILGAVPIENDTAIVPIAQFVNVKLP